MKYEGHETIILTDSVNNEMVRERIHEWLETKIGSNYRIQRSEGGTLVPNRTWTDDYCATFFILSAISGLIPILQTVVMGDLMMVMIEIGWSAVSLLGLLFWIYLFPSKIVITVGFENSKINLSLDSTKKEAAERDFDSLIKAIKGKFPVEETSSSQESNQEVTPGTKEDLFS